MTFKPAFPWNQRIYNANVKYISRYMYRETFCLSSASFPVLTFVQNGQEATVPRILWEGAMIFEAEKTTVLG